MSVKSTPYETINPKPRKILHTTPLQDITETPFSYINSLRLLHSIDFIISTSQTEFDATNKKVKVEGLIKSMLNAQELIFSTMRRSIGR
jgi:hypothetical protein